MTPRRPRLIAVDGETGRSPAPGPSDRRSGPWAMPWIAAAVVALAVAGWWLFLRADAELRSVRAELAREEARVFSLESRMLQLRRGASALAATLGAAEEQARALEALAVPEEETARLLQHENPAPSAPLGTDGGD